MTRNHSDWHNRRHDGRVANDADQVELRAMSLGHAPLSAATFDDEIAESLDDFETEADQDAPPWERDDHTGDNATDAIGHELKRREQLLGASYPFQIDRSALRYRSSQTLAYEFCLAATLGSLLDQKNFQQLQIAFERLARDLLERSLGASTQSIRVGWPLDSYEKRPNRFRDIVEDLNQRTNEWVWSPEVGLPEEPLPRNVKDAGLDFVVWKTFGDQRIGSLFFLGQCSCGKNYESKYYDLDTELSQLSQWIRPMTFVKPVRVFATSRHIPNDESLKEASRAAGLTLDRARITLLAENDQEKSWLTDRTKVPLEQLIRLAVNHFTRDE